MSTPSPEPAPTADPAQPQQPPAPIARAAEVADASRVRRAPRYGRFGFVGLLAGAALSLALTFVPVTASQLSRGDLFLLLLLGFGTAGIFAGLTWALVSDRRSLRRRRGK